MDREFVYAFKDRDHLSPELYSRAFLLLEDTFLHRGRELREVKGLARTIKIALEKNQPVDPADYRHCLSPLCRCLLYKQTRVL